MTWFENWFADELYVELYSHRDAREARQAVDLFLGATGLQAPAALMDLACGTGRHAFEFARRGFHVVAVDLSRTLLAVARRKTQRFAGALSLVRADMRRIPAKRSMEAVAQLFTAFGYFATDEENAAVIAEVARALRPGGWYMLDFLNAAQVAESLKPKTERRAGECLVLEERRIEAGRIEKDITLMLPEGTRKHRESVRMFTADELSAMLKANGFRIAGIFGDYSGNAFHRGSERCIFLSRLATQNRATPQ